MNTPLVANLIRENKIAQISNYIVSGQKDGIILLNKYIEAPKSKGLIE